MAKFGNDKDLQQLFAHALDAKTKPAQQAAILRALAQAFQARKVRPAGNLGELQQLFGSKDPAVQQAAIDCAGLWKIESLQTPIRELAESGKTQAGLRNTSLFALARLGGKENQTLLLNLSQKDPSMDLRIAAIAALAEVNVKQAAAQAVSLMNGDAAPAQLSAVANIFLQRKGGRGCSGECSERKNDLQRCCDSTEPPRAVVRSGKPEPGESDCHCRRTVQQWSTAAG